MKKRNKQIANLLKLGVFLFGVPLLLWNCEKDENILEATNLENKHTFIKPELAIEEIKSIYNSNNHKRQKSSKEDQKVLNEINTKTLAKKNITDAGYKIYSFALKTSTLKKTVLSNLFFDNLFVNIDKGGNIAHHVVRYIPTKEWLESNRSITEYSGTIQYLSDLRSVVSSIELKKGVIIETSKKRKKNKTGAKGGCQLIYKMTVCGALDGDGLSCTHFYELQCGSGSSSSGSLSGGGDSVDGTNSGFGDLLDENESISGGGSGSSSNKGNSFTGSPIIGFCPDGTPSDVNGNCVVDDQIFNNLTGKALCVYNKLQAMSTNFKSMIKKFDGEFPVSHLKFTINNNLGNNVFGETQPPVNYVTEIQINGNGLSNLSDLGAATTFAHELIHAEIFRKMLSAAKKGDLNYLNSQTYTTQDRINYVNSLKNNFPGLYDYYWKRYKSGWNHNMMATHYRTTIADIIQSFDNNRLPRSTYESVAWAGLGEIENNQSTVAWQNLTSTEQQAITDMLNKYFFNGTSNCN